MNDNKDTIGPLPHWTKFLWDYKQCYDPEPVFCEIDLTNYCNRACWWCNASELKRYPKIDLSRHNFLKIYKKAEENNYGITFTGGGESLLHPLFREFFDIVVEGLKKGTIPNFGLVTNGDCHENLRYVMEKLQPITRHGVKAWWVRVSVNGIPKFSIKEETKEIMRDYPQQIGQSYIYGNDVEHINCVAMVKEIGHLSEYPPRIKPNHDWTDCYPNGYQDQCIGRKFHLIHEANGNIAYCCNARGLHGNPPPKCPKACPWGKPNFQDIWKVGPFS